MAVNSPLILLVADQLIVGGMQRQIIELLKGLQRQGRFRTALAVLDRGGELEEEARQYATTFVKVRRRARFDVTPALGLLREVRRLRVDLIHAFGWMSNLAALPAARLGRLPLISGSIRDVPPKFSHLEYCIRWSALSATRIVANSRAGLAAYGVAGHPRSRVIPNGLDWKRFEGVIPENNGKFAICMVANFSHYKDHATLIRALPLILQAVPEARLVLVGRDVGTLAQNRRLVSELGLDQAVKFVIGTSKPEPFIAGSRVCVLLSPQGESLSNAILEYLALGKPVVASNCPGNAELIGAEERGFLVPNHAPEILAQRIIQLWRDPQRARTMGETGRRLVKDNFLLEGMVTRYEELYGDLLSPNKRF